MSDTTPRVAAVVLNWNNYDDTAACLDSLLELEYDELMPIVVDNGSEDNSGKRIESEYPSIEVIFTGENLGFGAGMNAGIKLALSKDAEYVWIVNNDTIYPEPTILNELISIFDTNDDIGIVSPEIRCYPDTDNVWFRRGIIDNRSLNADHQCSQRSLLDLRLQRPPISAYTTDGLTENDYVPLCSAVVRRSVLETVGLLPEEYFLYYEDADYCQKVRQTGFRIVTVRDSTAYHRVNGSTDTNATSTYYIERNRLIYADKKELITPTFIIVSIWRFVLLFGYNVFKGNFETIRALWLGTDDGIKRIDSRGPYP